MRLPTIKLTLRQKEILTGLAVLVICLGVIAAGEAMLRIQQVLAFGTVRSVEFSDRYYIDSETGLRLAKPNSVHGKLYFNAQGFRSPDLTLPKPAGVRRIVFLGASTTLDAYAGDVGRTWPHLTTGLLRTAFPTCAIDYVNGGVAGFSSGRLVTPPTPTALFMMPASSLSTRALSPPRWAMAAVATRRIAAAATSRPRRT